MKAIMPAWFIHILAALGVKVIAEDVTNKGRIDLTIFAGKRIYMH